MPATERLAAAPTGLFDPARHEPLNGPPWNPDAARAAIDRIVAATLAERDADGLWAAHPKDDPPAPGTRYGSLYLGAGGILWALHRLQRLGHVSVLPADIDRPLPGLRQVDRAAEEPGAEGRASFLLGDAGLLLLEWQRSGDPALAAQLQALVEGNLAHPSREALWGSPGTLLAAAHMASAGGGAAWADLLQRGVDLLWQQMSYDDELGAWLWRQDMYGRVTRYLGAGHGFAGNVYTVLRAAPWLATSVVDAYVERALHLLQSQAMRADGCINWPALPDAEYRRTRLPLVQDCHGAPGIVCRLAGVPATPAWDGLLTGAAELTWRAGPLVKGPGLCHGTAGNGYALLKLWARSGDPLWLARAREFAVHAVGQVDAERARHGHSRHSLWKGDIGVAIYLASCLAGDADFPTLDVF